MSNPFLGAYEKKIDLGEYKKALNLFYNPDAKCPACPSNTINERSYTENKTLKMSCTKCKWEVSIVLPEIVDLYVEESDATVERINAVYQMLGAVDKKSFSVGKEAFDDNEAILKDINALLDKQIEEGKRLKTSFYDKYNQLLDIYYKRQEIYPKLDKGIANNIVKDLYIVVKNEGYPLKGARLKSVATQYSLSEDSLNDWLQWLHFALEYEKLQKEVEERNDKLHKFEAKIDKFNNSIMIKSPKVTGGKLTTKTKTIKIKRSRIKAPAKDVIVTKID